MRKLVLVAVLLIPTAATAQQWEYRVVHLPPTFEPGTAKPKPGALVELEDGSNLNTVMANALNKHARDGWELIAVTGQGGTNHTAFLRRSKR